MRSSLQLLMRSLIFYFHLVGIVTAFQPHQSRRQLVIIEGNSGAYRITSSHHRYQHPRTKSSCLFYYAKNKEFFTKQWNSKYQELAEFYKKRGHLEVKRSMNNHLYDWMANQRRKRKGDKGRAPLTEEQIQLLDELGFDWNPIRPKSRRLLEKAWSLKYLELAEFYKEHGHLNVEYSGSLYTWMYRQRSKRRENLLTDEQVQKLDDIDFDWNAKATAWMKWTHKKWMSNYDELAEFHKEHGHLRVDSKSNIYQWMIIQRRKLKGNRGLYRPLTDEQIQLLDDINFDWNPKRSRTKAS